MANAKTETMERERQTRRRKKHVTEKEVEIEQEVRRELEGLLQRQRKRENIDWRRKLDPEVRREDRDKLL